MKIPTQVRFFIPTAVEALDQTTEPTLEDLSGEDFLGNALADTDQVVNAMDGHPLRPFQVDTDADATVFRIDAEMDQRERVSFLLVDQHNLRDAYPAATKEQIDIHHHSSDAFGSATELVPTKELDGLIGKQRPYLDCDGIDDRASVSDDADLEMVSTATLEAWVRIPSGASGGIVLGKYTMSGNQREYFFALSSTGIMSHIHSSTGGSVADVTCQATTDTALSDLTEWKHIALVYDGGAGTIVFYGDGAAIANTINTGSVQSSWFGGTSGFAIGDRGDGNSYFDGDIQLVRVWNRALSAAEVLTLYTGGTPIPEADQWAKKDLLTSANATSDQQTEGNSVAAWTGSDATLSSVTSAEGFSPPAGTYMLKLVPTSTPAQARQSFTTIVGKLYTTWAYLRDANIAEGLLTLRIGTSAGDNNLGESSAVSANDTWQLKTVSFTATGTTTHLSVSKITSAAFLCYADDVYVSKAGCVAEYHPSGINEQDGKWYDSSDNDLDGTISGADYKDVPTTTDDFYLAEFAEADDPFWFIRFNADGVTGTAAIDALIGQIVLGRIYSFNGFKPEGGYSGEYGYPGIITSETDAGNILTERRYGRRPTWDLAFQLSTVAQFEELQEMLDIVQNSLYPFYVCFNYDEPQPVIWRVRLQEGLPWSYKHGLDQPYSPTISLIGD